MKLTIERAALLRALGHVQSVVERRNTIPILSNVLLNAEGSRLSLTATDMDLEIVETVEAQVATPGAITAPAHTFYEIARKLPDGAQVDVEGRPGEHMTVRSGRSVFRLGVLPVEDFPQMAGGDLPVRFALGAGDLRAMIDRTKFAISADETRYYLNGIYMHAGEREGVPVMKAVATDGHRLARVEMPLPDGAAEMPGIIVPRKTIGEIAKLIGDLDEEVQVELSDTKVRLSFGPVVLTSKLIDGTFPDYERVIPAGNDKVLEVEPKRFAQAVDRVSTITTDRGRAVKLALAPGQLTVSATSPDAGSADEELEVAYDADALEIGFNARYLLDITGQIDGDGCRVIIADGASPTIIQDAADGSAIYVLMPMRV